MSMQHSSLIYFQYYIEAIVFQVSLGLSSAVFESPGSKFQESHVKIQKCVD